jgi:GNAT superfamily N-acetyltransferase
METFTSPETPSRYPILVFGPTNLTDLIEYLDTSNHLKLQQAVLKVAEGWTLDLKEGYRTLTVRVRQGGYVLAAIDPCLSEGQQTVGYASLVPTAIYFATERLKKHYPDHFPESNSPTWACTGLGVDKNYRHKKIGTQLITARQNLVPPGATVITNIEAKNLASITAHEKLGWRIMGKPYEHTDDGVAKKFLGMIWTAPPAGKT